jgi:hypothetical protein
LESWKLLIRPLLAYVVGPWFSGRAVLG